MSSRSDTDSRPRPVEVKSRRMRIASRIRAYLKVLGPGLITGASDDDPSGVGTYSQTGAQFGYTQLWAALFTLPLMAGVQEICARIALETGAGLAQVVRRHYPRSVLYVCVTLLVAANTINLGADLGAMAAAGRLLFPLPYYAWLLGLTAVIAVLQVWVDYSRYARILRLLTLSLFAYVVVAFIVPQDWGAILRHTFVPQVQFNRDFLFNLVAVLGTTISPYLFFWQASQEVEEEIAHGKVTPAMRRGVTRRELRWMRADVLTGMIVSNVVMFFIIVTTASTLHAHGILQVDSASKAAEALKPVAGPFASVLFAAGIIGTGLLAVPVLAGSAAYAVADTFKIQQGLSLKLRQAPGFYATIVLSILIGAGLNLIGINPLTALYDTAVINGLIAPPLMVLIMLISNNRNIMAERVNGRLSNVLGWTATAVMTAASIALVVSFIRGG